MNGCRLGFCVSAASECAGNQDSRREESLSQYQSKAGAIEVAISTDFVPHPLCRAGIPVYPLIECHWSLQMRAD
jgi:hypothetical protein